MANEENPQQNTAPVQEDKPFYKTTKGIIAIVAVCCVGIIIVALASGMLGSDNTSTTSDIGSTSGNDDTSVDTSNDDKESETSYSGYQVKVIYDGSWSGAAGGTDSINSYDGTGDETIDLGDVPYGIVSANAQKQDGSSDKLTIQILKDGKVVKEGSTSAAYGVAQVTSS